MHFLIPIELCEYVIRHNFYRPMQLYIYLKSRCSGLINTKEINYEDLGDAIGLTSARAVKNNLKILLKENWIGYHKKAKVYYVRGFQRLIAKYGFVSRTAAVFETSEISNIKAFMAGAKIAYLVNRQKRKERATECKNGRSLQVARKSSGYYPLANLAFAKVLGISISTAYELKQIAYAAGYVDIKKSFVKTGLDQNHCTPLKRGLPEIRNKVRIRKKQIYLQGIDMVCPNIKFRKRKKPETYIMGGKGGNILTREKRMQRKDE